MYWEKYYEMLSKTQLNRIFNAASILLSVDCRALITAALSNPMFYDSKLEIDERISCVKTEKIAFGITSVDIIMEEVLSNQVIYKISEDFITISDCMVCSEGGEDAVIPTPPPAAALPTAPMFKSLPIRPCKK